MMYGTDNLLIHYFSMFIVQIFSIIFRNICGVDDYYECVIHHVFDNSAQEIFYILKIVREIIKINNPYVMI